jgi:molybdopterin molybdotransferase/putative molybdopterin biosynthesis protein
MPPFEVGPTRQEVLEMIFATWPPTKNVEKTERLPLAQAIGRILARDYQALYNQPVVRASAMDGVAVKSSAFVEDTKPDTSHWRLGEEYVRADTGDDFSDDYDAVVPIEKVELLENGGIKLDLTICARAHGGPGGLPPGVKVSDKNCDEGCTGRFDCDKKPKFAPPAGFNVRPAGSSVPQGEPLAQSGTRLTPLDLAALATGGIAEVEVRIRPKVAFIPTGSELIPLGATPERGKTIDSNSVLVAAMLEEMGAEALIFPIARDDEAALEAVLNTALGSADIVLINAGSSKGGEDFNARLLERRGEILCHWIAAAPGRPLAAAMIEGKPVLNIPGPPLATYYVMDWCTRALVARALGVKPQEKPIVEAKLAEDMGAPPFMEILHRLDVSRDAEGAYRAAPLPMRQVSAPHILASNAQFINPLNLKEGYKQNEYLKVELLRNPSEF